MDDKNKVISFDQIKKKKDEPKPVEKTGSGNLDRFSEIFRQMGIEIDESTREKLERSIDNSEISELIGKIDINSLDMSNLEKLTEEVKSMEKRYRQQQMSYRTFGQWINFYRPYKFENIYPIEFLKEITIFMNMDLPERSSKNEIIEALKPHMEEYLNRVFRLITSEEMAHIGQIVYNEGAMEFSRVMNEREELKMDFLVSRCLIARAKTGNSKYLIIPQEVMESIEKLDFNDINKYNSLNSKIIRLAVGHVNSYGIIPFEMLEEKLYILLSDQISTMMDRNRFKSHIRELFEFSFAKSVLEKSLYSNIISNGGYIHHAVIGVVQNLIDIQNESIKNYKEYDIQELIHRGDPHYYEDSLALTLIIDMLESENRLTEDEKEELKNLIFTFSKIEFEPGFILNMLQMNYALPQGSQYQLFLENIRAYYKTSEKWILKGYAPGESDRENDDSVSKFDAGKIINVDFRTQ